MNTYLPEYLPTNRPIWLVFDLSNGHAPVKRYVWWFDTRKDALAHIKHQRRHINNAPVSAPVRFKPTKMKPKPLKGIW